MWPAAKPVVELVQSLNLTGIDVNTLRFCLEAENVGLTRTSLLVPIACPVLYVDVQRVENPHQFQDFTGRVVSSVFIVAICTRNEQRLDGGIVTLRVLAGFLSTMLVSTCIHLR
jgi:hypothetical protein